MIFLFFWPWYFLFMILHLLLISDFPKGTKYPRPSGGHDSIQTWARTSRTIPQSPAGLNCYEMVSCQSCALRERPTLTRSRDFIDLTKSFLCFFALRSSVMLFTLRLLPFTKRWPRRVIECSFFLNIIITIIAVVSYGIKCVPFTAIYKPVPGAWCERQNILVTTQQVNGGKHIRDHGFEMRKLTCSPLSRSQSSRLHHRHCHSLDTCFSLMEPQDKTANENLPEHYFFAWPNDISSKHWSCGYDECGRASNGFHM